MSMKTVLLSNRITVKGDGSDCTVSVNLTTAPVIYNDAEMASTFNLGLTKPSDVFGVTASSGTVSDVDYSALTGVMTVTFASALAAGSYSVLTFHLEF